MTFLVDAQFPRKMVPWLTVEGCDALHTLDLPSGNQTTDKQIIEAAERGHWMQPSAGTGS